MSEQQSKSNESKITPPDELAKTKKPGEIQLTEEELAKAYGGANKVFITYD